MTIVFSSRFVCSGVACFPARQAAAVGKNGRVSQYKQPRQVVVHAQQLFEYSPSISVNESSSGAQMTCTAPVEAGEVLVSIHQDGWLDCSKVAASSIGPATTGVQPAATVRQ
jgi:hypothetical protein